MITTFFLLPIILFVGILHISSCKEREDKDYIRTAGLLISIVIFLLSLNLWVLFDKSIPGYQFLASYPFISQLGLSITFGIDGISLFFILLTTFIIPFCLLSS